MDTDKIRAYVRLRTLQHTAEAEAEDYKKQANDLQDELLEQFAEEGVRKISVDGVTTYLHRVLWAKVEEGASREQVVEGLKACGFGQFVSETYNTQTVSAWLRDLEREKEPLPEELQGVLTGTEVFTLRNRKA